MFRIKETNGVYAFYGRLDGLANFSLIPEGRNVLTICLRNLSQANLTGIKSWIYFLEQNAQRRTIIINCPSFFIDQMGFFPVLQAKLEIQSFYLPFYCCKCYGEQNEHIDLRNEKAISLHMLKDLMVRYRCQSCHSKVEFDDDLDIFRQMLVSHHDTTPLEQIV